jgi:hypothetical protein
VRLRSTRFDAAAQASVVSTFAPPAASTLNSLGANFQMILLGIALLGSNQKSHLSESVFQNMKIKETEKRENPNSFTCYIAFYTISRCIDSCFDDSCYRTKR